MVRCLVSSMVAVGRGVLEEGEISKRLASGDRHQLPQPAPAAGLALIDVGYDDPER
jgi:tRNA U38,U39,U40 pseudouridine synthase TruA